MSQTIIQLGDIIRIISPKDTSFHGKTFYVYYYDPNGIMELIQTSSMELKTFHLQNGSTEEWQNWEKIELCNRSLQKGFARQNGLLPGEWVELEFHSDVREIITAKIQHLEEDMITLLTHPSGNTIYIDFAYRGIPKNIPLRNICLCEPPKSYVQQSNLAQTDNNDDQSKDVEDSHDNSENENENENTTVVEDDVIESVTPSGEVEIAIPDDVPMEEDHLKTVEEEVYKSLQNERIHQNNVDGLRDELYVPKPTLLQVRYNVDVQMNDLLEGLVHQLPEEKRTVLAMKQIYTHIDRFKELRQLYSSTDAYGKVNGFVSHSNPKLYKPLLDYTNPFHLTKHWIIPVIQANTPTYGNNDDNSDENGTDDSTLFMYDTLESEITINKNETNYISRLKQLGSGYTYWKPYDTDSKSSFHVPVQDDVDVVLNNTIIRVHGEQHMYSLPTVAENNVKRSPCLVSIPQESIAINSLMLMPETTIKEANRQHILSTILEKSHYTTPFLSYWLRSVKPTTMLVNMETIEQRLEGKTESTIYPLENKILHLDSNIQYNSDLVSGNEYYSNLLRCVIPNAFALIEKYKSQQTHVYSLSNYVKPFSTYGYNTNTLPFTAMKMIKYQIQDNIREYHDVRKRRKVDYNQYLVNTQSSYTDTFVQKYFNVDNRHLQNILVKAYGLKLKLVNNQLLMEHTHNLLNQINLQDNMKLFSTLILLQNLELITPTIQSNFVEAQHYYDVNQKAIAKKYESIQAMQKDNDVRDLQYDKQYDANQYDVLEKYKKLKAGMSADEYHTMIASKLAEDYGCSIQNTDSLATELIQGHKKVKEGDYALLEIVPTLPMGIQECDLTENEKSEIVIEANVRKVQKYFKRIGNTWVYDSEVDSSSFAKSTDLTCSIKLDSTENQNEMMEKYGDKVVEIRANINKEIVKIEKQLAMTTVQKGLKRKLFDTEHRKIGSKIDESSERMVSPYQETLNRIRNTTNDFVLKQENIRIFRYQCCRDAMELENQHWYYCKDTSLQLLPRFEYELAEAFFQGNYEKTLYKLKQNSKKIDGFYYDIHTGYPICEVDLVDDFGMTDDYDAFIEDQITWDAEANDDMFYEPNERLYQSEKYTDPTLRKCFHILKMICKNVFIPVDKIEKNAMNLISQFLVDKKVFKNREKYEKLYKQTLEAELKKQEKIQKKPLPYDEYFNTILLNVISCSLIISIQCQTPSIRPHRTFGQCLKDLTGYPLQEDITEDGTIVYLSCILRAMRSDTHPWKTISKSKGKMEKRLLDTLRDFVLKNETVQELLREKREYLAETKLPSIPDKLDVKQMWPRFLPPSTIEVVKHTDTIKPITKTVHQSFETTVRTGNKDQWKYYGMYFGKSMLFSMGIAEMVNTVVKEKGQILGIHKPYPIIENTCCNELDNPINPILYFTKENPEIKHYINNVNKISNYFDTNLKPISRSNALLPPPSTFTKNRLESQNIFCFYDEVMMYKTLIRYFQLDSTIKPIPAFLQPFLATKPEEYNKHGSIEEKIYLLKEKVPAMNVKQFSSIMTKVYRKNVVKIVEPLEIQHKRAVLNSWDKWKTCIHESIENSNIDSADDVLLPLQNIQDLLEKYFERKMESDLHAVEEEKYNENEERKDADTKLNEPVELLNNLENGLEIQIRQMKQYLQNKISVFEDFSTFSHIFSPTGSHSTKLCFEKWNIDSNINYLDMTRLLKQYLYYISVLVPSYVVKNPKEPHINFSKWKLNKNDLEKLKDVAFDKYTDIISKSNPTIRQVFQRLKTSFKTIYDTVSLMYGCFPEERASLYKRYLLFCIYYVFYRLLHIDDEIIEELSKEDADEEDDFEMIDDDIVNVDYVDKSNVEHQVIGFLQFIVGLDSKVKNKTVQRIQESIMDYDVIQSNIDKIRSREKEHIQENFRTNNKKMLAIEKALKKVRMGDYYTNPDVLKKYGKRDKYTRDVNYLKDTSDDIDAEQYMNQLVNVDEVGHVYEHDDDEMVDEGNDDVDENIDEDDNDEEEFNFSEEYYLDNDDNDIMENKSDFID